jgi:hypothetical protein
MQGLPRHLGQHTGGMVIAAGRLDEVVPLEPARCRGGTSSSGTRRTAPTSGSSRSTSSGSACWPALEEAIPLVREHEGVALDLAHLPQDDPTVYAMLRRADTIGVFQVESRAQMATLPRMRPDHFYDLVVEVAIIRPGPIVGQMVHPYLARRNGRAPVTYAHPLLEPILARTLGVPLFQEQLLRMAMAVAGFTGGEAEELRRALGFRRSNARMESIEAKLRAGMAARGITGEVQEEIIKQITSFALYGFPESHSASFALIAYASAYLKAHHPRRLRVRAPQLLADGLLPSGDRREGRAAPRGRRAADRRRALGVEVHARGRRAPARAPLRPRAPAGGGRAARRRAAVRVRGRGRAGRTAPAERARRPRPRRSLRDPRARAARGALAGGGRGARSGEPPRPRAGAGDHHAAPAHDRHRGDGRGLRGDAHDGRPARHGASPERLRAEACAPPATSATSRTARGSASPAT